ncbi:uncharacterized protein THITE_35664 [Thermothielavioides terrestris NRRL 8126]|uniref:PHD-type domain-containing protein n=1 Tax=Thermothielavioides terrestris (strain ATCC 38088 / NRRL 8126) TaxID=578455 RepID=G2R237_THETT|nr:uncharacterized protein THITE_35664 [Thermothielavioides terrestris NRRL 8126]AEO66621.1 hypothetical protein THITE_35664 [Thermothielavioides terrestris NRRL 8126]
MADPEPSQPTKDAADAADAAEGATTDPVREPVPAPGAGSGPAPDPAPAPAPGPAPGAGPNPNASPSPAPAPASAQAPASTSASPSVAPSAATRPQYLQQFSAVTQMILQRIKGEPNSLSAALSQASRSPSVTASIPTATYEDVKRRLVMSMNTSTQLTMQMPAAAPVRPAPVAATPRPAATSASGMSAIRKVTAGLTGLSKSTAAKATAPRVLSSESKIKKTKPPTRPRGPSAKRKRVKAERDHGDNDDASITPSLSSRSTPEALPSPAAGPEQSSTTTAPPTPATVTKSGRQVLKPAAYNPAAMDAAGRRPPRPPHHYGKRTAEQALCRKCSRMHSPAANQMVFCDGCNDGWHQRCHEPRIADAVVRDTRQGWFCAACAAKRDREREKEKERLKVEHGRQAGARESWASRPPQQKRAYLLTLSQQELVGLLMSCLELHPDLPIFPATAAASPRSLFAGATTEGLFPRVEANPLAQINYVRKIGGGGGSKAAAQERVKAEEEEEFDPLVALWPKPGTGLYAQLPPDTEDDARLKDDADYEAFSVILYDERWRKVEENGMPV